MSPAQSYVPDFRFVSSIRPQPQISAGDAITCIHKWQENWRMEVAAGSQAGAAPEDQAIVADSKLKALLKEVSVWMRAHERECSSCWRHPTAPLQ
jgi:hypothetical protein